MTTSLLLRISFWWCSATVLIAQSLMAASNHPFVFTPVSDPRVCFQLTPPGWSTTILPDGHIQAKRRVGKGKVGATVEVWDYALPQFQTFESFVTFKERLYKSLRNAYQHAPMSYASYDLSLLMEYMAAHGSTAGIDMVNVQNMLSRYGSANPGGIRTPSSTDPPRFVGRR